MPFSPFLLLLSSSLLLLVGAAARLPAGEMTPEKAARLARTVILDEVAVKNLRLETVEAEEKPFETTVFALGRIEAQPQRRAVVTSRVPGRILELKVRPGDKVAAGAEVARIETRQPGDPPPSVALRAPLAGEVTSAELRLGEPVEPDRVVLEIMDLGEVQLVARVPEHLAIHLPPGTKARVRFPGQEARRFEGTLQRLSSLTEREGGTVDAYVALPNADGLLRPGQRAEVELVRSVRPDVRVVPRSALQGDGAQRFVFVKDYDLPNAFVRTPVVVGEQNGQDVEIVEGLLPGDEVVTRGAYALASAGRGTVSLKAALDAAHGHEHNEDGTEMTDEQRAARARAGGASAAGPWQFNRLAAVLAGLAVFLAVLWLSSLRRAAA